MNYSTPFNEYMKKEDSSPFSFRINKQDKNTFQKLYPYCLSRFIKLCISKAVRDPEFFNKIYFNVQEN